MLEMGTVAWSFAAAVIGWLTLEFVGRRFRRFYDLRGEIISRLVQFSNGVPAGRKSQTMSALCPVIARSSLCQKRQLRDCTKLRTFSATLLRNCGPSR